MRQNRSPHRRLFALLRPAAALALTAALAAIACGGDAASPDATPPVPLDQLGGQLASWYCGSSKACLGAGFEDVYTGLDDCKARYLDAFNASQYPGLKEAVDAGRVAYDGTKVPACIARLEALGCSSQGSSIREQCPELWTGKVAPQGPCRMDFECAVDRLCKLDASCPGTCATLGPEGGGCDSRKDCKLDLDCINNNCVKLTAIGGACGNGLPACVGEAECAGYDPISSAKGTCKPWAPARYLKEGESCESNATFTHCAPGLACVYKQDGASLSKVCVAKVASGAACPRPVYTDQSPCPGDEYCAEIKGNSGTCKPSPTAGQGCASTPQEPFVQCARGLLCNTDKKCQKPGKKGAPCTDSFECNGACVDDACADKTGCAH